MNLKLNFMAMSIVTALCALGSGAHAEEEGKKKPSDVKQLDSVMVSADRKVRSMQDVPTSITALTSDDIDKANIDGIESILQKTPNVSYVSNGSRDRKEISIRGISNQINSYSDLRPSSYAFYIDDFSVVAGTSNPEVLDMQRIEILRGPQGTFFGRNSLGGAINIYTNKPEDTWSGQLGVGYSRYNTREVTGVLNAPVKPGLFDLRLAVKEEKSDGNIKNINAIGGGNDSTYKTARIIARLTPTDRLTWDNTLSYSSERTGMRAGVPSGFLTATWRSIYYDGGSIADPDGVGFYPSNTDKVNFNRPQSVGTRFWYASSHLDYDFDTAKLTAVVGHLASTVFNHGDVDGGSYDYFYEDDVMHRQSNSVEVRLQSTGKQRLEWSVGAMGGQDNGTTNQYTYYGADNPWGMPTGFAVTGFRGDASTRYSALFGQATFHFTDALELSLGGRYSHEKADYYLVDSSNEVVTNVSDRGASFNDFSPQVSLSWRPSLDAMYYATVSKGFKSGGVQTSQLSQKNTYKPEKLYNYELGAKYDLFDRRMRLNVSAFYMDWRDVQQTVAFQYLDASNNLISISGIDNAAKARSYGLDAGLDFRMTDDLTWSTQVGYLNAKYLDYKSALVDGQTVDASGSPMINAPKWTIGSQLEYRHPAFADFDYLVIGEFYHRSQMLSSKYALLYKEWPFISPSYNTFNLRAGLDSDKLSVQLYVENLLNKKYYNNVYEKAFYSGVQLEPAYRNFGVKVSYKFN